MAIDPRISLAVQVPQVSQAINIFENALMNSQTRAIRKQEADQRALLNPLIVEQQKQAIDTNRLTLLDDRDKSRLTSTAIFAADVLPSLRSGDISTARSKALRRKSELSRRISSGENIDTTEIDEFINTLDTDPEQAKMLATQGVQLGERLGVFKGNVSLTSGQKDRQSLIRDLQGAINESGQLIDPENMTAVQKSAAISLNLLAPTRESALERILESKDLTGKAINIEGEKSGAKESARLSEQLKTQPLITSAVETSKLEPELRMETQRSNIKRMSELQDGEKTRNASTKKASQFLRALKSGNAQSGATRSALSFVPGVFSSQAQFDERFNAFAEVAARQQLKAAGEIRPTDADVEGMKRAMFGVGRDEQTNIQLLEEFISAQQDQGDELEDLKESRRNKTLDQFGAEPQQLSTDQRGLSTEEQVELEALKAEFGVQ